MRHHAPGTWTLVAVAVVVTAGLYALFCREAYYAWIALNQ